MVSLASHQVFTLDTNTDFHGRSKVPVDLSPQDHSLTDTRGSQEVEVIDAEEFTRTSCVSGRCDLGRHFHPGHDLASKGDLVGVCIGGQQEVCHFDRGV